MKRAQLPVFTLVENSVLFTLRECQVPCNIPLLVGPSTRLNPVPRVRPNSGGSTSTSKSKFGFHEDHDSKQRDFGRDTIVKLPVLNILAENYQLKQIDSMLQCIVIT